MVLLFMLDYVYIRFWVFGWRNLLVRVSILFLLVVIISVYVIFW